MANPLTRKFFGIPAWALVVGVLAGIVFGSYDQLRALLDNNEAGGASTEVRDDQSAPAPASAAASQVGAQSTPPVSRPPERNLQIRVDDGLLFEPAVVDGLFAGYRVITNLEDPRFKVGDIVTAIDGNPVEDSAAGSELFMAGLMNRNAEVEVRAAPEAE